jgi:hypothetical protein
LNRVAKRRNIQEQKMFRINKKDPDRIRVQERIEIQKGSEFKNRDSKE